jgi:hypothetical protein
MSDQPQTQPVDDGQYREAVNALDDLLARLKVKASAADAVRPPDAIDRELARPSRETRVVELADSPAMQAFRQALVDETIRRDAVISLLGLVQQMIGAIGIMP